MQKKLTLGTRSLQRQIKDVEVSYKERDIEVKRLEKMQNETDDNFRLNQQRTVVAQYTQSITDYKTMLGKGIEKLEQLVREAAGDVTCDAEVAAAKEMIEKAKQALE